jgi:fructose-bisphosphate aldolase class II
MTDPDQAVEFVKTTKIDTLAPSVGAMHGLFKGKEKINFDILKKIREKVKIPLVLHGASGVPDEDIKAAIKNGIAVINIDTRLRQAFTKTLREDLMSNVHEIDPRKILNPCIDAIQKVVEEKIDLFGSYNKA